MVDVGAGVGAALVALAFAMSTFERWLDRRRPHELAWSVSLAMFAVASAALAAGSAAGWSGVDFRVFYLFGGILNVPYLALGSIYLLGGRRLGGRCAAGVSLGAAFAVGVLVTAPFTHALPLHRLAQGSAVFGPLPQVLAGVASGGAATVVVACALWSALRYRWGRMLAANVLIAVGTLVTGASGLLNSVVDQMTGFAVTLVIGISIIFVGFLVASGRSGQAPAAAASREVPAGVEPEAGVPGDAGDAPLLTPDLAGRRPGPGEVPQPASVYRSAR